MSLTKRQMAWLCAGAVAGGIALAIVLHICRAQTGGQRDVTQTSAPLSRANDVEYRKQLVELRSGEVGAVNALAKVESQLAAVRAKARAALGKRDATDAEAEAEILAHPDLYPEWKGLLTLRSKAEARVKARQKETREAVRARILREMADREAARDGKTAAK